MKIPHNRLLSAVIHYIKSQLGLIVMIACLVIMYDANIWDWEYWLTGILTWLAYGYSGDYNWRSCRTQNFKKRERNIQINFRQNEE